MVLGIPEHKVDMPPKGGRPSQNDLYVLAKSGADLVSIAVEGKVNESLGPLVSEWAADLTPGKKERLNYLINILGLGDIDISNIRYQLLHRTASALIEAERFCARHAVMLVHSFSQEHKWFNDYSDFVKLFGPDADLNSLVYVGNRNQTIPLYLGWIVGGAEYLDK